MITFGRLDGLDLEEDGVWGLWTSLGFAVAHDVQLFESPSLTNQDEQIS